MKPEVQKRWRSCLRFINSYMDMGPVEGVYHNQKKQLFSAAFSVY